MKNLYELSKRIASEISEAIVMFSTGKDSIVTLDLCARYLKRVKPVYLYSVKGLSYKDRFLKFYEKKYNVIIDQYPLPDTSNIFNNNTYTNRTKKISKINYNDIELFLRKKYGISYIAYGYRKIESLQRRGQLSQCNGFDKKFKRLFPVAEWNDKDILNYLKYKKLPLPVEYSFGFRDINFYEGKNLIWLYQNYPEDYEKVKKVYPMIEVELRRAYGGHQKI